VGPAELAQYLASGVALLIGTADNDGTPNLARAWAATPDHSGRRLRLLVPVADSQALSNMRANGRVALSASQPRDYRSVQLKGHTVAVGEPLSAEDIGAFSEYCEAFGEAAASIGVDPGWLAQNLPGPCTAVVVAVDAAFEQTPGPGAGRGLSLDQ
jgi:predicted pyridoxine 5'-phosphate oxidase superfamily flavin-nucleotide-binding protein